jgi:hypothetical protein
MSYAGQSQAVLCDATINEARRTTRFVDDGAERAMVTTADYLHSFVEPMAEPPRKVPVRRRFAAAQRFP